MDKKLEKEITRENCKQNYCCIETVFITVTDAVSKPHHEQTYHNISEAVAALGKALTDSERKDTQNDTQGCPEISPGLPLCQHVEHDSLEISRSFIKFKRNIRC